MRIAVVHSFYSSDVPSGENAVVREQVDALAEAGHDVMLVARHTDADGRQALYPLRAAARVATGRGPDPTDDLRRFGPDVVHVHNLFPNYGTQWLRRWPGPVVATLHNFRPVCANGLLYRDGHHCEECPTSSSLAAVRHGCYHGSRLASIPLAVRNARGPAHDAVLSRADALVCLSQQSADAYRRLTALDLPLHVVPNGIDVAVATREPEPNGRWLVVSRLTPEKGVRELVALWPSDAGLDIVGTGPDEGAIRAKGGPAVRLLGALPRDQVTAIMPDYLGLVFPSRCMEMQPTVLTEALASGLPVVALEGSAGSALRTVGAGTSYTGAESLAAALAEVNAHRDRMSAEARAAHQRVGGRGQWAQRLVDLYAAVLSSRSHP